MAKGFLTPAWYSYVHYCGNPAPEIGCENEDSHYDNGCCTAQELHQACTRILCTIACTFIRSRSPEDSHRGVQIVEYQQAFGALAPPPGDIAAKTAPLIDGMQNKGDKDYTSAQTELSEALLPIPGGACSPPFDCQFSVHAKFKRSNAYLPGRTPHRGNTAQHPSYCSYALARILDS